MKCFEYQLRDTIEYQFDGGTQKTRAQITSVIEVICDIGRDQKKPH